LPPVNIVLVLEDAEQGISTFRRLGCGQIFPSDFFDEMAMTTLRLVWKLGTEDEHQDTIWCTSLLCERLWASVQLISRWKKGRVTKGDNGKFFDAFVPTWKFNGRPNRYEGSVLPCWLCCWSCNRSFQDWKHEMEWLLRGSELQTFAWCARRLFLGLEYYRFRYALRPSQWSWDSMCPRLPSEDYDIWWQVSWTQDRIKERFQPPGY